MPAGSTSRTSSTKPAIGRLRLRESGIYTPSKPTRAGYPHEQMTDAITGSLGLAAIKHGLVYGDQEEISDIGSVRRRPGSSRCPCHSSLANGRLNMRAGKLRRIQDTIIPDQLFRITYPDNIKFFVLEADRASEDYETVRAVASPRD